VELNKELSYHLSAALGEGREVTTLFEPQGENTLVTTTFDPENENPVEMQKMGW
jgi:hypothetical protein